MNLKKLISDSQSFASTRVFTSSGEANKFLADHPEYRVVPNAQGVPDTSVSVALVNDAGFVSDAVLFDYVSPNTNHNSNTSFYDFSQSTLEKVEELNKEGSPGIVLNAKGRTPALSWDSFLESYDGKPEAEITNFYFDTEDPNGLRLYVACKDFYTNSVYLKDEDLEDVEFVLSSGYLN